MKIRFFLTLVLFLLSVLAAGDDKSFSVSARSGERRVQFQVMTIEETAGGRKVLAETIVEGLPGTDFNINLQTERFKMQARFLTDLIASDALKIRANLNTRRLFGYSPANLPLYEEDAQKHALEINFDETIVLLPFGRGAAETLKIEITPTLLSASTDETPLKINIGKQLSSGEIFVEAAKIPHRFETEVVLLADGQEVARAVADSLLEEAGEIILQPDAKAEKEITEKPLTVKLSVDKYTRSRPSDSVAISFNVYRARDNQIETIIPKAAGAAPLGGELRYVLEENYFSGGKKYELKFKVRLAKGERAD